MNIRKRPMILIIAVLLLLLLFLFADAWLLDRIENAVSGGGTTVYSLVSAAENGTVYALGRRGEACVLSRGDCNGGHDWVHPIERNGLPEQFRVDGLTALSDGGVLLSLYSLDGEGKPESLRLYRISDAGGTPEQILSVSCTERRWERTPVLSSFACYNGEVRFLLWQNEVFTSYIYKASASELSASGSFPGARQSAALVLSDGSIALGQPGGEIAVLSAAGGKQYALQVGGTVSALYQGSEEFYVLDASADTLSGIARNGADYYRTQQFAVNPDYPLAVQPEGIVLWLENGTLMKNDAAVTAPLNSALYARAWNSRLILAACLALILGLSAVIFRVFYGKKRVRCSLLLRNGAVLAVLLAAVFVLGRDVLLPSLVNSALRQAEQTVSASACLAVALGGGAETPAEVAQSLEDAGLYGAEVTLYRYAEGGYEVLASNAGLEAGTVSAGNAVMRRAAARGVEYVSNPGINGTVCHAVASAGENLLELKVDISAAASAARAQSSKLMTLLAAERTFCMLVVFALLLRLWGGIHRIACGMRLVAGGTYDVELVNPSGDELEDVAKTFNNMTHFLRKSQEQSKQVGENYMRFIPEDTIKLMGVASLEDVTRETVSNHRMVVMTVRFRIPEEGGAERTEGLFNDINSVIEQTTFAAVSYAGNSFNFTYDGYNVVFPTEYMEESVRAAIAVENAVKAINKERERMGRPVVELRVAMDCGLVRMGIVGDELHMVPAAISQCLEMNERLLAVGERVDAHILCSENLLPGLGTRRNRCVGRLGGELPVRVFEAIDGDAFLTAQKKAETAQQFDEAIHSFYARDFAGAKKQFMKLARYGDRDGAVRYYLDLSDRYERSAPEELSLETR